MAITVDDLENLLRAGFPDAQINITDLAGDNNHYALDIADKSFEGKSRIAQHQLVYKALQGEMGGALHALQLKTRIPN